jgi:hypothetical protein
MEPDPESPKSETERISLLPFASSADHEIDF